MAESAWLPTRGELETSVYALLRDSDHSYVQETEVDEWLNKGYMDLNARLKLKQNTATGTTSAAGVITPLPTELVEPLSLWFDTVQASFVDNDKFEGWAVGSSDTPYVQLARFFNDQIETFPVVNAGDYTLRYVERPDEMTQDSDTPTALTPELAERLIYYALWQAKIKEGEYTEAMEYKGRYLEGLPGPHRPDGFLSPIPRILIPESGPFG